MDRLAGKKFTFRSITVKHLAASVLAMLFLGLYIFGVFYSLNHAKGESTRINLTGSLRFHSFRMAWLIKLIEDVKDQGLREALIAELKHEVSIFDIIIEGINTGSGKLGFKPIKHYEDQADLFKRVSGRWHTYLRPSIMKLLTVFESSGSLRDKDYKIELRLFHEKYDFIIDAYVNEIDEFVSYAVIHYDDELSAFEQQSIYFLGILLIMAILLFLYVKRTFVRPIVRLNNTVIAFEDGQYDSRIEVKNRDEIGSLANSFNNMADKIKKLFDENRSLIENLETTVNERTRQLALANAEMERSNLDLERFGSRLYKLYEVSYAAKENAQEFTTMLLNEMAELLDIQSVVVGTRQQDAWVAYAVSDRNDLGVKAGSRLPFCSTCCAAASEVLQPVLIKNLSALDKVKDPQKLLECGAASYISVPIVIGSDFFGSLCSFSRQPGHFTEQDLILHQILSKRLEFEFIKERYENDLRTALLYAEAANKAKSDFLANMSHELRTPLNAIMGFSDTMLNGFAGEISAKQKEYLSYIFESGQHLLSIINDILDLSKIEAGSMGLEKSVFSIRELLTSSISMFREKLVSHGINLEVAIEDGIEYIEADRVKIKQVIVNLVSNALKFTPDRGSVSVRARRGVRDLGLGVSKKEPDQASAPTVGSPQPPVPNGDFIEISVADTGIGISQEDQAKLFKPFQQLELALNKKYSGTGLGLSLCKKMVELHGGSIWCESEKDKGSRFVFIISTTFSE